MNRGTEVGRAYVDVEINGDGMNEDIVDAVDGAGPGVGRAGEEHGERYGDGFEEGFFDRITDTLSKHLEKELDKDFTNMGKRLGRSLSNSIGKAMSEKMDEIEESTHRLVNLIETKVSGNGAGGGGGGGGNRPTAGGVGDGTPDDNGNRVFYARFEAARVALHAAANKAISAEDSALLKTQKALYADVLKMEEDRTLFTSRFAAARAKLDAESAKATDKHEKDRVKAGQAADRDLLKSQQSLYDDLLRGEKSRTDFVAKFLNARQKLQEDSNNTIYRDDEDLAKRQRSLFDRLQRENDKRLRDEERNSRGPSIGDRVGSMFGADSRVGPLRVLGSMIGNVVNLAEKATNVAGKVGSTFMKGFSEAGEGATLAQKAFSGLSSVGSAAAEAGVSAFTSIAASGPVAVVAIGAVIVVMSVLVSVMSALLALATAFLATIVSGLVGGLAVLSGGILAVVAAGGLLTAAFMSMTDAQKTMLKDAFQPLRAEMVGIGQVMLKELIPAFSTWSSNLQRALMLALPVASVMGKAFAEAGNNLTASFSGPGFQAFATAMGSYLPAIVEHLSMALGSFLNGMLGLFAVLMPYVNQFAGYLERVAARFSDWANSAAGQNSIRDFMDRALVSLQALWNAVREFSGFLAAVLFSPSAQGLGNDMFSGIAKSFSDLTAYVSQDGVLEDWFNNAAIFGQRLWDVIQGIGEVIGALNSSGVLTMVGDALSALAWAMGVLADGITPVVDGFGMLGNILGPLTSPLGVIASLFTDIGAGSSAAAEGGDKASGSFGPLPGIFAAALSPMGAFANLLGGISGSSRQAASDVLTMGNVINAVTNGLARGSVKGSDDALAKRAGDAQRRSLPTLPGLIDAGNTAIKGTDIPKPKTPKVQKYVNPYEDYANSLIKKAPAMAKQIKTATKKMNTQVNAALAAEAKSNNREQTRANLLTQADALKAQGSSLTEGAQSNLNSAAQALASAGNKKDAAAALKKVRASQKEMKLAIAAQKRLDRAAAIVNAQRVTSEANVAQLLQGNMVGTATLADFATARERVAVMLDDANEKLAAAISMRDQYKDAVTESARAFGALTTAVAQTINGVEQALTATDITSNLQDRLTKIQHFRDTLRLLLANGLSDDAYKQIVDQGVEGGTAYADAILAGGTSAVQDVNNLVGQVVDATSGLGAETSSRLYQAGVDAAQGLVDGLNSLSGELDTAAARLGLSIANAVKKALGIASPSKVMIGLMDHVGDGIETGLDDQHSKVGRAANRLSDQIQVSPEAAALAGSRTAPAVSGNTTEHNWHITTPTEDPKAVAQEMMNEMVGRL